MDKPTANLFGAYSPQSKKRKASAPQGGDNGPPREQPLPRKYQFKTSESPSSSWPYDMSSNRHHHHDDDHHGIVPPIYPMLQQVQGQPTMYNTFQHGQHDATESRIIMDRKVRLEQVYGDGGSGGVDDALLVDMTTIEDDDAEADDRQGFASLLDRDSSSPTPSMEAFLDLGRPGDEPFSYRAEAASVRPTTMAVPRANSDLHSMGTTWYSHSHPPPPPPYHRAHQIYHDADHSGANGDDPFVGNMFHPVENGGLDSLHYEADHQFPFHAPEMHGPPRHIPTSSFYAIPAHHVGRTMVHTPQRSVFIPAPPKRTVFAPHGSATAVHRARQEDYQGQEATEPHHPDDDISSRDGKHWNSSEDAILMHAMTIHGPPTDWGHISKVFFAESRSASSCKHRWRKIDKATNRGDFSDRESALIIEQRATGKSWSEIAKSLSNRTADQVKFHHEKIDPSRTKTKWSLSEDETLLAAQSRLGNKWLLISASLPGRSSNDVKNRWSVLGRQSGRQNNHQHAAAAPLYFPKDAA